jgi:choline dehydrogenase-like flavoprotein
LILPVDGPGESARVRGAVLDEREFRGTAFVDEFDVCIVGSGPAGAILACELVRRGVKTVLLEGGGIPSSSQVNRGSYSNNLNSVSKTIDYPIDSTRFFGDGGTSNLWGGECPRFQPLDFEPTNLYVQGEATWPMTYESIEPYYQKAEQELYVHGGQPTQYSPPRSKSYSLGPMPRQSISAMKEILGNEGWVVEHSPRSSSKGEPGVRVAQTHLPRFLSSSNGRFVRGARVTRLITGPAGKITGLQTQNLNHETKAIHARFYVLACGGIETPRILLLSKSSEFPRGVGNQSDLVGRYFMEHLAVSVGSAILKKNGTGFGVDPEEAISWQFYRDFKSRGLGGAIFEFQFSPTGATLGISVVIEMKPSSANRVVLSAKGRDYFGLPTAAVRLSISDNERKTWEHVKKVADKIFSSLDAEGVRFGKGEFQWTHHHMGTCRMGNDSRASVVDKHLRVHGVENLYIAGSAPLVTCGVGSPTLLISALSLRLADRLIEVIRRR